jgi:hypothetical protein
MQFRVVAETTAPISRVHRAPGCQTILRSSSGTTTNPTPIRRDSDVLPGAADASAVTVALNGDAGDENFAGYGTIAPTLAASTIAPSVRRIILRGRGCNRGRPTACAAGRGASSLRCHSRASSHARFMHFRGLLKGDHHARFAAASGTPAAWLAGWYAGPLPPDFVDAALDVDVNAPARRPLARVRSPAWRTAWKPLAVPDHEFVEFVASLPSGSSCAAGRRVSLAGRARSLAGHHHRSARWVSAFRSASGSARTA